LEGIAALPHRVRRRQRVGRAQEAALGEQRATRHVPVSASGMQTLKNHLKHLKHSFSFKNLQNTDITLLHLGLARPVFVKPRMNPNIFMSARISRVLQTISSLSGDIKALI
jgi:hypothetical protein